MRQISLRLDPKLLERIDTARGPIPRERFLRELIAAQLDALDDVKALADRPLESERLARFR